VRARCILGLAFAFVLGCSKRTPPPPPDPAPSAAPVALEADADAPQAEAARPLNVLVISVDSLRADMPWAGYARPIAPRLTALHAQSIAYANAYSTSSFTSKSLAGLLTGKYPSELARTGAFFTRYLDKNDFFCTALGAQQIPCVGGHAHAYFGKNQAGFEHGFRDWRLVPGITFDYETDPYVTSDKLTPLAIEMLGQVATGERPFFAWFHFMDPHDQYKSHPESPKLGRSARDLYDEEVFFTDLWIGKLLDYVESQPWGARTAVVVTADHGEAFGEHGIYRHAHEVWEELVHVPMFFRVPGAQPRVIDEPRGHADLAPTIVELLGGAPLEGVQGTSLVGELRGGDAPARDVIVDLPEDDYNERRRALIHGRTKLIAFGNDVRFSLFDLETDPGEKTDLYFKRRDLAEEMRGRYREANKKIKDVPPRGGIPKKDKDAGR
jgi:arylsulfatase A-like enzyme